MDELLDTLQRGLATLRIDLAGLLADEPFDVGIGPVLEGAAGGHERMRRVEALPAAPLAVWMMFFSFLSRFWAMNAARSSGRSFVRMPAALR